MEKHNTPASWLPPYEKAQRQPHATKSGPGRRHKQEHPHGRIGVATKGAPVGFVQHVNPKRNAERRALRASKPGRATA